MNKEFSAGAIIFKQDKKKIVFLLLYSSRNKIWGFPKGHIEPGEDEEQAAMRELREEAGLKDLEIINGFREEIIYETISTRLPFKGQRIEKHAVYFLCNAGDQDVRVDGREMTDYKFVSISEAEQLIKFDNLKKILRKANDFLAQDEKIS
jgi:8-oxo-dGTP pyrophosphatase MutT (NUDIX family)